MTEICNGLEERDVVYVVAERHGSGGFEPDCIDFVGHHFWKIEANRHGDDVCPASNCPEEPVRETKRGPPVLSDHLAYQQLFDIRREASTKIINTSAGNNCCTMGPVSV